MGAKIVLALVALGVVALLFFKVKQLPEGTPDMIEKADIIRRGADAFMITEYKVIVPVVLVIALAFSLFIEKSLGLAVILGALMSSLACIVGMKGALYANVRTTNTARETLDIGSTMQVALKGGGNCWICSTRLCIAWLCYYATPYRRSGSHCRWSRIPVVTGL